MEESWAKKFRAVTLGLIFSGALNIALLATIIFSQLSEKDGPVLPRASSEISGGENFQIIHSMKDLSFRELVSSLTNTERVDEGFLKRDLALACLVNYHHFNLKKALSGSPIQRRVVNLSQNETIELFPGLKGEEFRAIIKFAYEEKWPLTAKGLFELLKRSDSPDSSLIDAFMVSDQFFALQSLFQKSGAPQEKSTLIRLICEGSWELLERFTKEEEQMLDFSKEKRQRILLSYLRNESETAAKILLETDFNFALKKLTDAGMVVFLNLLNENEPQAVRFCSELLQAPRTDAVWKMATKKLYQFSGEPLPEPFDLTEAIAHFAPKTQIREKVEAPKVLKVQKPHKFHVVKEGDNLWKIARQYSMNVKELKKINELENDHLVPGMTLKVTL